MAKRYGGEFFGKVCACRLSMSDGKCSFGNLYADGTSIIVNTRNNERVTTIPFGRNMLAVIRKCRQRQMRKAVSREGGNAKRNLGIARERAGGNRACLARAKTIGTSPFPSPYSLARRRFRLAGKCTAFPVMPSCRHVQAFSTG